MKKSGLSRTYKYFRYNLLRRLPGVWGRYYERNFHRGCRALAAFDEALRRSEGMTCIDLGANVGNYTRKMALQGQTGNRPLNPIRGPARSFGPTLRISTTSK